MTVSRTPRLVSDMRGVRYGEVIAVFLRDCGFEAEVYGTQMLNDCPQDLWETLDADVIAAEMGAVAVKLNGPRHWMIDGLGTKVAVVEPVLRDFNGAHHAPHRHHRPRRQPGVAPYTEAHVNRGRGVLLRRRLAGLRAGRPRRTGLRDAGPTASAWIPP